MELTKIHKIIIGIVAGVVLLGTYIILDRKAGNDADNKIIDSGNTATTTGTTQENPEKDLIYKIEKIPASASPAVKVPDLDRPIIKFPVTNFVTEEDILTATSKVKELQSLLKKDPKNVSNWLELALYQKLGGDYEGAAISWKYVSEVIPGDYVSLGNLGDLYAYYVKNSAMSETYYKKAIARAPTQVYLYVHLVEVYRDVFGDMIKAKAIVEEGLKKLPNDEVLLSIKESLNK